MSNQETNKKETMKAFISLGYKLEAIKDFSPENYDYLMDEITRFFSEVPLVYSNRVEYYVNKVSGDKLPEYLFLFYNKAPTHDLIKVMRSVGFEYYSKTIEWKLSFPLQENSKKFLIQLGKACKKYICLSCNNPFEWLPNFDKEFKLDENFRPTKSQLTQGLECPVCKSNALKQDFTFLKGYNEKPVIESNPIIKESIPEPKKSEVVKEVSTKCQKCGGLSDYSKTVKGKKIYSCIDCGL